MVNMKINNIEELKDHMKKSIFHYIDIKLDKGLVSIENRPHYCDRGRFSVKVFPGCDITFDVDEQDRFPRYYFSFDNLLSEMCYWFEARKVNIIEIEMKEVELK